MVSKDPQTLAAGAVAEVEHPLVGKFRTVNTPFRIHGADVGPTAAAPEPGEHTGAVLAQAGYSAAEARELVEQKVAGFQPREGSPIARWAAVVGAAAAGDGDDDGS